MDNCALVSIDLPKDGMEYIRSSFACDGSEYGGNDMDREMEKSFPSLAKSLIIICDSI